MNLFQATIAASNGIHVHVLADQPCVVRRGWRERLFSWPWRPWRKTKAGVVPCYIPDDRAFLIGGTLYCNTRFYERLKAEFSSPTQPQGEK